jgi:hypothetical protein
MRHLNSLTAVGLLGSLMAFTSDGAAYKPPGCFKRDKLEASLKGERKIPYDSQAPRLKHCQVTQPIVSDELRRAKQTRVAIIVFDVTGTGRVVEQQLIGQKSPWSEIAQKEVAQWLFEPLVEDDIGITRVGVTVALIASFEDFGQKCIGVTQQPVIQGIDFEIYVCASR